MSKRQQYSPEETRAIAAAYVRMAVNQFNGQRYSKADVVRGLLHAMPHRTRGAIEAKFMNLSAVAVRSNLLPILPNGYVQGYKPAPNGAKALHNALIIEIYRNREAHAAFNAYAATGGDVEHITIAVG